MLGRFRACRMPLFASGPARVSTYPVKVLCLLAAVRAGFGCQACMRALEFVRLAAMRAVASSNLWMSWCSGTVPGRSR
jgi:hypothetical protein